MSIFVLPFCRVKLDTRLTSERLVLAQIDAAEQKLQEKVQSTLKEFSEMVCTGYIDSSIYIIITHHLQVFTFHVVTSDYYVHALTV